MRARRITIHTSLLVALALALALAALQGISACTYPFELRPVETVCAGGLDEDGDGLTDCHDPDCGGAVECAAEYLCEDGKDNDADGLTDCDDSDCSGEEVCIPQEICDDSQDNDGDGDIDCNDEDCVDALICMGPYPCNEDGVCEPPLEDQPWCADCCPGCSLNEGQAYDFIVSSIIAPTNTQEAEEIGVDLDGDGTIDNALGKVISEFSTDPEGDIRENMQEAIDDGEYIMLARLIVSSWPDDDAMAIQVFAGDPTNDATEDNLTGNGHALIAMQSDRSVYLCSDLVAGHVDSCWAPVEIPFFLLDTTVTFPFQRGRVTSTQPLTQDGWQGLMIGGAMDRETLNITLLPTMLVHWNEQTKEEPDSQTGQFVLTFVDGACSTDYPGCEDVVPGEGACSYWTGDPADQPLTLKELQCSSFIQSFLVMDVDSDGDGVPDLLSFGAQVDAIPITIDN
mgnify:CR=1 FL=1